MNKDASKSKTLILNLGIALLAYVITVILGMVITLPFSGYTRNAIGELIVFVVFYIATCFAKKKDILKFKTEGFGIGIIISIFLLIRTALALFAFIYRNNGAPIISISILEIISLVLFSLLVGLSEELLFRGVVQGSLHDYFGEDNSKNVRLAIIIASVLFGLVHLVNAIGNDNSLVTVLVQIISAIGAGFMFGTIYYRSNKNLWVGVIIHAFNDLVSFVYSGSLNGGTVSDSINSVASTSVFVAASAQGIFTLICLAICLFFTRKKVVEKQITNTNK